MDAMSVGRVADRYCLNPGRPRQTWHVVIETDEKLPFKPGDSVAIWPKNHPEQVHALLDYFGIAEDTSLAHGKEMVPAGELFSERIEINRGPKSFEGYDLPTFLRTHYPKGLPIEEFQGMPLRPRLYSIASGSSFDKKELLVAQAQYECEHGMKQGVCSYYLTERAPIGKFDFSVSMHSPRKFCFPSSMPLIMIGAGTGMAPFRSFMQEVEIGSISCPKAWFFFGEQQEEYDYFYRDFWESLKERGRLRLDLAFSRDQATKIYVQHRIWEQKKELWQWIIDGATIMVCGNAQKMAKDVDSILARIAMQEGKMDESTALSWLRSLHHENRYMRDIY